MSAPSPPLPSPPLSPSSLSDLSPNDRAKLFAAKYAADLVEDGMKVGLGTGSTAAWMVRCLAARVREEGLRVSGVATSTRTADLARSLGVPVVTLESAQWLDLTIDGADEADSDLNLIKGGGAALLHEKIVATASERMIVIADPAKRVACLGAFPLPVEVIPFGWEATQKLVLRALEREGFGASASAQLRLEGALPVLTDEGNYVLDLHLGRISEPRALANALNQIAGVVENGLFIDICDQVVLSDAQGRISLYGPGGACEEHSLSPQALEGALAL